MENLHKHQHPAKFHRPDGVNQTLYCITPIFNPRRYRSRWKHYKNFEKFIIDSGAHLIIIEASLGEREQVYTETVSDRHTIIHVRTKHEMWLKENLMNIAIAQLGHIDPHWKYVCTVDADMQFARPDWVGETLHELQRYKVVQMFSDVVYLGPEWEIISTAISFMEGWRRGIPFMNKKGVVQDEGFFKHTPSFCNRPYGEHNHHHHIGWAGAPGGAWAYRREALDSLGGLIDFAILGSADYHMATALMGFLHISIQSGYNKEYIQWMMDWQDRCNRHIRRNVGHVKGTILHHWHGKMRDRGYGDRWKILVKHQFNPRLHLKKDTNGVYQLNDDNWQLRDDVREYFNRRNEDSVDK